MYVAIGDGYYDAEGNQGSGATATFTVAPRRLTGLTVTAGHAKLGLSWTAPAGTVTGYDVHYTLGARRPAPEWSRTTRRFRAGPVSLGRRRLGGRFAQRHGGPPTRLPA